MTSVRYPMSSKLLSEARLYAQESYNHTMDYQGWEDQRLKLARMTYGKFGQLWVTEFCRANDIKCEKDTSSPYVADELDLTICGHVVDVKTTINRVFLGQVSPGVIDKPCEFFCFIVTDKECSFVEPVGFIDCEAYKAIAVCVKQGETIPGTTSKQRFNTSYFLPKGAPVVPFVQFLMKLQGAAKVQRAISETAA